MSEPAEVGVRRKILKLSAHALGDLLRPRQDGAFCIVRNGLPSDAKFVGASYDPKSEEFLTAWESAEFPLARWGSLMEIMDDPTIQVVRIHNVPAAF